MRRACEEQSSLPSILFVHQGSREEGERFFARQWPEARAISDPKLELYETFGIGRARARELLSPSYLLAATASLLRVGCGRPQGDVMRRPGAFLVQGERVLWSHAFRHFGDHPSLAEIARLTSAWEQAP